MKKISGKEDIVEMLQSGWIYVIPSNKVDKGYFEESFFDHVPKKEKFKFGEGWFIKKSFSLYKKLINMGMPDNSPSYDSCILMAMSRLGNDIRINMFSLKGDDKIDDVAEEIMMNDTERGNK